VDDISVQRPQDWTALAGTLLGAFGDHVAEVGEPTWIQIAEDPQDSDVRQLCFSQEPTGFLGWVAPAHCRAVGVVATGRMFVESGPAETPVPLPPGVTPGVRMACVVSRQGDVGWRMVLPGGVVTDHAPTEGRLLDCLRRCFALPTPQPPSGPGRLQSVLWLAEILDEAQDSQKILSWREIVRMHPVLGPILGAEGVELAPSEVPEVVRLAAANWSWEKLRQDAVRNGWASSVVPVDVAAWMDEGMFARWILAELPDTDDLLGRVRAVVAPSTARRLAHTVRAAA
jgi:hypothetical protein